MQQNKVYFSAWTKNTVMKVLYEDYEGDDILDMALGRDQSFVIVGKSETKGTHCSYQLSPKVKDELLRARQKIKYVSMGSSGQLFIIYEDGSWAADGPKQFLERIKQIRKRVRSVSFLARNGWIIVFNDGRAEWESETPNWNDSTYFELLRALADAKNRKEPIEKITTGWDGEFCIVYADGRYLLHRNPDDRFRDEVRSIRQRSGKIKTVEFGPMGSFVIFYSLG
eukprot:TRINITY_DN2788_c0_g1_i10.p3 TRINITY_DN2788_c0_g1~~TRINITY_DN2788_c0_g1_i10.p3  ORF type:complete len:225 (-),score=30.35 TRINITY_DN2788_c0_g1_i10:197-871(-)